ncbi:hypothetical protein TVAG_395260 [Trichomonas vaginalis G3]|uniref:Uncharacterized protein n=1 Tax=Trichomonas vaginalis (strain ATCC PRA-98 / G3) TaxID=412133 RepID=A2F1B5_TRIV3|nr:hypothetical protein TVAGG3_0075300 [Trichomonas vaginalis G3]EAY01279.1 hypothetical protein TVAG_395260 [Trichomonas vaginalis G3]KAI5542807.1 hypothetical protein TVAGG3_0075300 [Trichomonas vaginalis G3]|eukprot:XP_001314086.1 hypothetical protein [Trichomonas vaginalis G3]
MSKISGTSKELRITRHCELNRFVALVDQRAKHSSGLAIHQDIIPCKTDFQNKNQNKVANIEKSKYYRQAEENYKNRGKPNPDLIRNINAKKEASEKTKKNLKQYQRKLLQGTKTVQSFEVASQQPDARTLAIIRHLYLVGALPENLQFN